MEARPALPKHFHKEIARFLVVGTITAIVDYSTYVSLLYLTGLVSPSKACAFIFGTTCAYFLNRFWTFNGKAGEGRTIHRFLMVYAVSLLVNVGVNETVLFLGSGLQGIITIAFVIATGVSATMNFIGMKFLVFSAPKSQGVQPQTITERQR